MKRYWDRRFRIAVDVDVDLMLNCVWTVARRLAYYTHPAHNFLSFLPSHHRLRAEGVACVQLRLKTGTRGSWRRRPCTRACGTTRWMLCIKARLAWPVRRSARRTSQFSKHARRRTTAALVGLVACTTSPRNASSSVRLAEYACSSADPGKKKKQDAEFRRGFSCITTCTVAPTGQPPACFGVSTRWC